MTDEIKAEFRRLLARLGTEESWKTDSRLAAWLAFDIAAAESDSLRARAIAEELCVAIAQARGVRPSGFAVYRMRARDMIRYRDLIAVSPREIDPMTLAKRLRNEANQRGAQVDGSLINAVLAANQPTKDAIQALVAEGQLDQPA